MHLIVFNDGKVAPDTVLWIGAGGYIEPDKGRGAGWLVYSHWDQIGDREKPEIV